MFRFSGKNDLKMPKNTLKKIILFSSEMEVMPEVSLKLILQLPSPAPHGAWLRFIFLSLKVVNIVLHVDKRNSFFLGPNSL